MYKGKFCEPPGRSQQQQQQHHDHYQQQQLQHLPLLSSHIATDARHEFSVSLDRPPAVIMRLNGGDAYLGRYDLREGAAFDDRPSGC